MPGLRQSETTTRTNAQGVSIQVNDVEMHGPSLREIRNACAEFLEYEQTAAGGGGGGGGNGGDTKGHGNGRKHRGKTMTAGASSGS